MALTKVNSVGIATGISLTGITTTQDAKIGTGITLSPDGNVYATGVITATSYRGDVSNCTGVGQTNFIDAESLNVSGISTLNSTKVGTGITLSPDGDLYVTGIATVHNGFSGGAAANTDAAVILDNDSHTYVQFRTPATKEQGLLFGDDADNDAGAVTYSHPTNHLGFRVNGGEKVRISSAGYVGIGSADPTDTAGAGHCVDIQGASATAIYLRNSNRDTGQIDFAASTMTIRTRQATPILFNVNNSERARIDTSGRLLIGTTDTDSVSDGEVPKLIIKSTDSTAAAAFVRHSANAAGTGIFFGKSRNATVGSNTIVQSGDELGRITFSGDDGTNINTMGSKIASYVDGTPGENDMPGRLVFYTTADGASTPTERLRINSDGQISIRGTTTAFDTTGDLDSLQLYYETDSGQASIGPYSSGGSTHLSFYTNASSGAATEKLRITSAGNVLINNTTSSSRLAVRETDTSTGVYYNAHIMGSNHVADYAVGIGFDTEGYAARNKIGIVAEGTGAGYSRGKLHFLLDAANDSGQATLAESRMTILDSGSVLVGTTDDSSPDGFAHLVQVNSANHTGGISIGRHTANSNGPCLLFHKTRSGSATPGTGVLSNGDNMGTIRFYGSDGTDSNSSAAQIQCHIDATPGSNDMPGRLTFSTTRDGDSSSKDSMRIDSYGSLIQSGGHCSGAQMDSYTPGSDSLPKFFQSDGGTNNKSGDFWTTVLNVGTSHPTWDLFSIKGSTNFGIWVEVTCYFSQITSGTYGRQKVAYRVQRNGNNNFGTGVTNPYDKVENNNDKFIPTISTSGSGSSMRATFRIQGTGLTNYCQTMYHIRWVCGDNGAEPIVYY